MGSEGQEFVRCSWRERDGSCGAAEEASEDGRGAPGGKVRPCPNLATGREGRRRSLASRAGGASVVARTWEGRTAGRGNTALGEEGTAAEPREGAAGGAAGRETGVADGGAGRGGAERATTAAKLGGGWGTRGPEGGVGRGTEREGTCRTGGRKRAGGLGAAAHGPLRGGTAGPLPGCTGTLSLGFDTAR